MKVSGNLSSLRSVKKSKKANDALNGCENVEESFRFCDFFINFKDCINSSLRDAKF